MLSLPSSGESRELSIKRGLVLDLFLRRGPFWSGVKRIREQWKIEPVVKVPRPTRGFQCYTPGSSEPQDGMDTLSEESLWLEGLTVLHNETLPDEGRFPQYSLVSWRGFLSMCVCFDPPDTQLSEFAENLRWHAAAISNNKRGYAMYSPPLVSLRDANQVEAALVAFYERIIEALCQKYVHPQGVTTKEALKSIMDADDVEGGPEGDLGPLAQLSKKLFDIEALPYIHVQPHHQQKDVESAFRLLRAEQEARTSPGRKKRDALTAVQCAILHDRHGWKYERIAEKYGWDPGSNNVSKYIADGRSILKDT